MVSFKIKSIEIFSCRIIVCQTLNSTFLLALVSNPWCWVLTVRLEVHYTLMREDILRRHRKVRSAASNHGAAEAELPEPVQPDVKSNDSSGVRD